MTATVVTPTVTSTTESGDSGETKAHFTYATQVVGTLETDVTLALRRTGGC